MKESCTSLHSMRAHCLVRVENAPHISRIVQKSALVYKCFSQHFPLFFLFISIPSLPRLLTRARSLIRGQVVAHTLRNRASQNGSWTGRAVVVVVVFLYAKKKTCVLLSLFSLRIASFQSCICSLPPLELYLSFIFFFRTSSCHLLRLYRPKLHKNGRRERGVVTSTCVG